MASMSVSGIVSGMDWESMIDEIITNASKPAQPQVAKKTDLTNKKSLFEEMKTMMNSLQSSLSPLKLPSTYKAKEIEIERLDSTKSYKGVLTATVNADAEVNVWDVEVKQLATAQTNRSKQITASSLSSTLSGVTGSTMYIEAGGQKIGIEVKSNDTLDSLKSRINTTLKTLDNPIHVTASVVDNKLILKSDYTGLGSFTASETINYSSNGYNTLTGFTVSDDTRENVKITNGSTTYTYGTDYEIANGNEIRWKKYDQSDEVALNDKVTVKYNMAAGDVYTSKGTYDTEEANTSKFNVIDRGTIASRAKIVDDKGNTYTYGKDFKIVDSKVVWIEDTSSATNEPDTYTVNYSKTETAASTISGTKKATTETYTSEPDSYIVRYDDKANGSHDVTVNRTTGFYDSLTLDFNTVSELYKNTTGDDLKVLAVTHSSGNTSYIIDPSDRSAFKVTAGSTTYEYGKDFVVRTKNNSSDTTTQNWEIVWAGGNIVTDYARAKGTSFGTATAKPSSGSLTFSMDYSYDYTRTARVNASDNDKLLTTVFGSDFDMANFKPEKLTIRGYTYGTDYKVDSDGEITWIEKTSTAPSRDDAISDTDFTALETAYNTANGTTSIPTITLTDADGVLRTYLNPADASAFTMKSGNTTYEYGKDYVIRVNDDRNGYTISWAITDDSNADGSTDINDASTVVTTYTQYKGLTTHGMMKSPSDGDSYSLTYAGTYTTTDSGSVNKNSADKSLASVLKNVTVSSADYATTLTITDGTKTYAYGTDWTIDSSGNITWLEKNNSAPSSFTATYTVGQADITPDTTKSNYDVLSSGTSFPKIDTLMNYGFSVADVNAGSKTVRTIDVYNPSSAQDYKFEFSLKNSDGSYSVSDDYVYGRDFTVRKSDDVSNPSKQTLIAFYNRSEVTAYANLVGSDSSTYGSVDLSGTKHSRPNGDYRLSLIHNAASTDASSLSSLISEASGNYSGITITGNNGTTYTYSSAAPEDLADNEFTIVDGAIAFKPASAPKQPTGGYTLHYEAFDAIEATSGTYDGSSSTQEISIQVDDGYGNFDGNKRSYEQILNDTGLTSSSKSEDWAKYFTLETTDGATTYTYGTDYTLIQGSDTDSKTGEHNILINWLNKPAAGTTVKLSYGSNVGEVLTTDGVTRSATDNITGSPLATAFDGGTNTITYSGKTFYEGVDFDITEDDDGNATVTWIPDSDGGYEWYYPTSNSYYTINHTDDSGNTTSYNAWRTGSTTLNMLDYGMTTAGGSISVEYGGGLSYKLDAPDITYDDGTSATIAEAVKADYGIDITPTTGSSFTFNWVAPTLTSRSNLPAYGQELTVSYEYDANTFDLSDDGDGDLLQALGFTKSDGTYDDYTEAKNAVLVIDGEQEVERDSNDIGADYENELIKGVTMHLKGVGQVSLDISQDAEKAVESIQSFVDSYNELMSWMNTRMTESQLDEDTKATVDSDDFRMRWGLLHGNSLLRQTKSQMRSLTSQNFTFSFTQRKSSEEVYGTMGFNGLKTSSTLRLRIGTKFVDVTIDPTDTLDSIVRKISDDTKGGAMNDIYYDDSGNKLATPLLKAYVENDKLVIQSSSNDEITMSGSAAMNTLKMNYTYKGLYQLGIASTATDYGKSGELEFDANEFMEALEDNPDEVQSLMMTFVTQFDTWTKSMLNSSASGETSGTLTREIENIQSRIDSINEYLEKYQERLDRMEENLRTRYGNTETQFAKLSQQANSIAAILNQLNGSAQGGGYGQTSS